jgi:fatty-acyl-CoA synthase
MHSTLSERMQWLAQTQPDKLAILEPERHINFAQLTEQSDQLAGHFARLGMRSGDRLALWLPNGIEWVQCFLACARLGLTVLAVNTRFRAQEVQDVIERGKASWLVMWPGFKGIDFDGILADIPAQLTDRLKGIVTRDQIHRLGHTPMPPPASHADHGVLCFTTSGTTSLPKFVLHTQSGLLQHADAVSEAFEYDQCSRVMASAPFCGAFGFATLGGALFTGHTVVCEPVSDAQSLLELVRIHDVTHTYANNALILQMLQQATDQKDFASTRLFGFASFAPASQELFDRAKNNGLALTGLYGSSELQALLAAQPLADSDGDTSVRYEPGGAIVHRLGRVRARDPQSGRILPMGESGELEILTPSRLSGYLDNPQATREAFTDDGYYRTGDLGRCVSDRQFVFEARMGDSLRLAGFLVNPAEIEQTIETLPGVAACQVVAAQSGNKAVPVAFVILKADASALPEQWTSSCKRRMAGFKVPVHFEVVSAFPTIESANAVKIQKNRLRDMAQAILDQRAP